MRKQDIILIPASKARNTVYFWLKYVIFIIFEFSFICTKMLRYIKNANPMYIILYYICNQFTFYAHVSMQAQEAEMYTAQYLG